MPVLTSAELRMVTGEVEIRSPSTKEQVRKIEAKLLAFQKTLTSEDHIRAVNAFIDAASAEAERTAKSKGEFAKLFIAEMDRRTIDAGLRYRVADIPLYRRAGRAVQGLGVWEAQQLRN